MNQNMLKSAFLSIYINLRNVKSTLWQMLFFGPKTCDNLDQVIGLDGRNGSLAFISPTDILAGIFDVRI